MNGIGEEELMAYADGELDDARRAEIAAALERDPEAARVVARPRALRERLQAGFAAELEEPVPEALRQLLVPPATSAEGTADLAAHRGRRREPGARRVPGLPQWAAIAASLTLGVLIGHLLGGRDDSLATVDGRLVAAGRLAEALDRQLAAAPDADQPVRVILSYRDREGRVCRSFVATRPGEISGLACRTQGDWRLELLAPAPGAGGEMRAASSLPPAILAAIENSMAGEPFDAGAERAAREAGWR